MVGHRPSAKRGSQTGYRGAVSYAGLMIDIRQSHGAHRLGDEVGVLISNRGAAAPSNAVTAIDGASLAVPLDESRVARFLELAREPVHGEVPINLSPLARSRLAIHWTLPQPWANSQLHLGGALRTERPAVNWAV